MRMKGDALFAICSFEPDVNVCLMFLIFFCDCCGVLALKNRKQRKGERNGPCWDERVDFMVA